MAKVYGYMRVSTVGEAQRFDRQEAELKDQVDRLYRDRVSGSKRSRPQLDKMLDQLREGDTVLITSIDRLSRSTKDLLDIVAVIKERGASLKSIQDSWLDTSSENPMSDFLLTVMGALAEMERKQIVQRVNEGLAQARARGEVLGRPTVGTKKIELAFELYDSGKYTSTEVAEMAGISRSTLYKRLRERKQ